MPITYILGVSFLYRRLEAHPSTHNTQNATTANPRAACLTDLMAIPDILSQILSLLLDSSIFVTYW